MDTNQRQEERWFSLALEWPVTPIVDGSKSVLTGMIQGESGEPIPAALKVFKNGYETHDIAGAAQRREVMLLSRMDHPHIVKFLRFFYDKHQPVIATRLVEGSTLLEKVIEAHEGGVDPGRAWYLEVLEWGFHLAWVMHYLEACEIVHRDIKPSNIVIDDERKQPVLINFGIGRLTPAGSEAQPGSPGRFSEVSAGRFVGTRVFASPEQFDRPDGKGIGEASFKSDIYSLGVTLAYSLCQECVRFGDDVDDPRERKIDLSVMPKIEGLRQLLEQMLQPEPEDRPSGKDVAMRIYHILEKNFDQLPKAVSVVEPRPLANQGQLPPFREFSNGQQIATGLLDVSSAIYYDPDSLETIELTHRDEVERRSFEAATKLVQKINHHLEGEEWIYQLPDRNEWSAAAGFTDGAIARGGPPNRLQDVGRELEWLRDIPPHAPECALTASLGDEYPEFLDRHQKWPKGGIRLIRYPRAEKEGS